MLKSFVDKIHTKMKPWVYGCSCCMGRGAKPILRRQTRRKLKIMLKKEVE